MITAGCLDIFNVYRSSNGSKEDLRDTLCSEVSSSNASIICGDFNVCGRTEKSNKITDELRRHGFDQLVDEATHIQGRQIDHVYFRGSGASEVFSMERYSPYYSDHDAILVCVKSKVKVCL